MSAARKHAELPMHEAEHREARRRIMDGVQFLALNYFRIVTVVEDESVFHNHRPHIFAANHSGMNFPWDCITLCGVLQEKVGEHREIRALITPMLLNNPLLSMFVLPESWRYVANGASMPVFEEQMERGHDVILTPEGIAGIAKGFNRRYQLQPFSSSFVRMCLKHNRPLVPISIVNGEYLNPMAYSSKWLNRVVSFLGVPFLPIGPAVLLCLIFPGWAYIALPARMHFVVGRKIDVRAMTTKPYDELTTPEIKELTKTIQAKMQRLLDENVELYGHTPYDLPGFWKSVRESGPRLWALIPFTWSILFHRAYLGEEYTWRQAALSALICIALLLPVLGWPLLAVIAAGLFIARRRDSAKS